MRFFILSFALLLFVSCSDRKSFVFTAPMPESMEPAKGEAVATFAEGCYWHTEIVFQCLSGVRDAVSGYSAGAESVNVYYDSSKLSFQTLVDAFFTSHDPTQVNRQGPDVGPQYRSVGFYRTPKEKWILESAIATLNASGRYKKGVATEVLPFRDFERAGDDQQEYVSKNPDQVYVKYYNIPDYIKFRLNFPGPYKDTLVSQ